MVEQVENLITYKEKCACNFRRYISVIGNQYNKNSMKGLIL